MSDNNDWDGFNEVGAGGETFNIIENKKFKGIYTGSTPEAGDFKSTVYNFKDESGKLISIWGSTVLDRKMALIPRGDMVIIEYLGMTKNPATGRSYHDFKVGNKKPDQTSTVTGETETSETNTVSEDTSAPKGDEEIKEDLPF